MKSESGITIIALVVTIVILIILAGISINLTLGQDGLITKAKQAKENIELAQIEEQNHLNELYSYLGSELDSSGNISYDSIAKLAEFKKAIADYIDEAGGIKPDYGADTITFGDSIKGIVKEVTKNATATADNISKGKTAWINGQLIVGNGIDNDSFYKKGMGDATANLKFDFNYINTLEGDKTYTTPSYCDFLIAYASYSTAGTTKSNNLTISGLPNMVEISKKMNYYVDGTTNGFIIVYAYNVPAETVIQFSTDRNIELAQIEEQTHLNELYAGLDSEIGSFGDISYDAIAKLSEFKKAIADYIEQAGGVKPEYNAETVTFGDSIKGIVKEVTKTATATADNISEGKTAYVNGQKIIGTGVDNEAFYKKGYADGALNSAGKIVYVYHKHVDSCYSVCNIKHQQSGWRPLNDETNDPKDAGIYTDCRITHSSCELAENNFTSTHRHFMDWPGYYPTATTFNEPHNYLTCGKTEETIESASIVFE